MTHSGEHFHTMPSGEPQQNWRYKMSNSDNWIVVFRDTHEETGADSIGISVIGGELEPGASVRINGETWTHCAVYDSMEKAAAKARSMTVKNRNFSRGFGPTPIRYVGLLLKAKA